MGFPDKIIKTAKDHLNNKNAMPEPAVNTKAFADAMKENKGLCTVLPDGCSERTGTGRDRAKSSYNLEYAFFPCPVLCGDVSGYMNLSAKQVVAMHETGVYDAVGEVTESQNEDKTKTYYNVKCIRVLITQPTQ